jgi:hypothetical protein
MAGWYERWSKLTKGEQYYLFLHPWHADDIEDAANKALSEAAHRFGQGSLHNGSGDAFRHCYWNALLARDIGKDNALEFTTAHENRPGNPADERAMDLWNNAVGANIGAASAMFSDAVLAAQSLDALNNGKLKVLTP